MKLAVIKNILIMNGPIREKTFRALGTCNV